MTQSTEMSSTSSNLPDGTTKPLRMSTRSPTWSPSQGGAHAAVSRPDMQTASMVRPMICSLMTSSIPAGCLRAPGSIATMADHQRLAQFFIAMPAERPFALPAKEIAGAPGCRGVAGWSRAPSALDRIFWHRPQNAALDERPGWGRRTSKVRRSKTFRAVRNQPWSPARKRFGGCWTAARRWRSIAGRSSNASTRPTRSRGSRAGRTSFTGWSEGRRQARGVVFRAGSVQHSTRARLPAAPHGTKPDRQRCPSWNPVEGRVPWAEASCSGCSECQSRSSF